MLVILQGVSGAGKSTKAKELQRLYDAVICSTDDYFAENGKYNFRADKLHEFHKKNQERAFELMLRGRHVIIDNTNLKNWEIRPYVVVAKELGIEIRIIRCDGGFKGIHGVPEDKVNSMRQSMETLDPEIALNSKAPWEK